VALLVARLPLGLPVDCLFVMEVVIVTALDDNFTYILVDTVNKIGAAVDPVDPEKTIAECQQRGIELAYILTTHSHWDHDGTCSTTASDIASCCIENAELDVNRC
jgi:glyoxylase-like metal-dependent hydrolase (beta-lactamase superfamily II)